MRKTAKIAKNAKGSRRPLGPSEKEFAKNKARWKYFPSIICELTLFLANSFSEGTPAASGGVPVSVASSL